MMAIWAWLTSQEWFRKLVVILGLVLAVLLALAGFRRKSEQTGRLIEREVHRAEAEKVRKRVEEVERKMDEVPRPDRPDVDRRLRDETF